MKTALKIIGIVILCIVILIAALLIYMSHKPAVAKDYTQKVKTGGEIEATYLENGRYEVSSLEINAMQDFKKYEIFYPSDIADGSKKYPVFIFSNGTGIKASKYKAVLEHLLLVD